MYFEDDKVARHYSDGFDAGYKLALHELGMTKGSVALMVQKNARDIMWLQLASKRLRQDIPSYEEDCDPADPESAGIFYWLNKKKTELRTTRAKLKKLANAQRIYKAILRG